MSMNCNCEREWSFRGIGATRFGVHVVLGIISTVEVVSYSLSSVFKSYIQK